MKKPISVLLIIGLSFLLLNAINEVMDLFDHSAELSVNRMSNGFIHKNITESNTGVVYGKSSGLEDGSANLVTSVVVDYRSFDTLGEVTVLFISALGVGLLLSNGKTMSQKSGFVLKVASKMLSPLILLVGLFVFTHGHLTPGGGFPGGSMIATAFLLHYLGTGTIGISELKLKRIEGISGLMYIAVGLVGLFLMGSFLQNFLPTGTVGKLLSAGIIPIVYIFIGIKVGAEVSGIIGDFSKSEVNS